MQTSDFPQRALLSKRVLKSAWRISAMFLYTIILILLVTWNVLLGYVLVTNLHMNDFGKFYYTARAFIDGGDMYGPSPATLLPISPLLWMHFWNLNPPHFHLPLLPLALVPPDVALAIWTVVNLLAFVGSVVLIVKELDITLQPWPVALLILVFLAFSGTGSLALSGQMTFLLLPLLTLAWVKYRRDQWEQAAIYLGLAMSIKLFLLLFLLCFLIMGRYRAAAIAWAVNSVCYLIGLLIFGSEAYHSWLSALRSVEWITQSHNASLLGFLSRTFWESPLFEPITILPSVTTLWLFGAIGLVIVTLAIIRLDGSWTTADRAFALILITALLVSPLGWIYYLFLPLGPLTALALAWTRSHTANSTRVESSLLFAKNVFLAGSVPGLFLPPQLSILFQPNPIATLLLANIYFWSLVTLWLALVCDWLLTQKNIPVQPRNNSLAVACSHS